jgi:hypothetical protein
LRKSAQALADHLAAHGVKTEHISDWTNTGDLTAIEALFASLDTQDADLIVAGAYGHSRLYEGLFGGVTMDLMHQQSLPVLMSRGSVCGETRRQRCRSETLVVSVVGECPKGRNGRGTTGGLNR